MSETFPATPNVSSKQNIVDAEPTPDMRLGVLRHFSERFRGSRIKSDETMSPDIVVESIDLPTPLNSSEQGRERVKAIFGRSAVAAKETTRQIFGRAKIAGGRAANVSKEAGERIFEYFTDEEKGAKRVIVAGAIGAVAAAAAYGVYRNHKNAEKMPDKLQEPQEPELHEQSRPKEQWGDSIGKDNKWAEYADKIDFRDATIVNLRKLGYGPHTAEVVHSIIVGELGRKITSAEDLRAAAKDEIQRSIGLDKYLDKVFDPPLSTRTHARGTRPTATSSAQNTTEYGKSSAESIAIRRRKKQAGL